MSLVLQSSGGGSVTIAEPATASNFTQDLPAASGTVALLQTPSFATTIGVGGATPAASGAGITFPASQSASTDANTLDDYEEGTFEVTLTPAGGSMTMDTNRNTFQYVKIGRMVYVQGYTRPSSVSSPTGVVTFTLPFTATAGTEFSAYTYGVAIGENLVSGVGNGFSVLVEPSSATATIKYTAGGTSAANWEAVGQKFQANTNIVIGLAYQV